MVNLKQPIKCSLCGNSGYLTPTKYGDRYTCKDCDTYSWGPGLMVTKEIHRTRKARMHRRKAGGYANKMKQS